MHAVLEGARLLSFRALFITAHHIGTVLEKESGMRFPALVESTKITLAFLVNKSDHATISEEYPYP